MGPSAPSQLRWVAIAARCARGNGAVCADAKALCCASGERAVSSRVHPRSARAAALLLSRTRTASSDVRKIPRCPVHRPGSARFSLSRQAGKTRDHADQAADDAARLVARLLARRGCSRTGHRARARACLRLYQQGQSGGRHLQRHRHPRPGQSRRASGQAGDGGQGRPLQALRRHRRHGRSGRYRPTSMPSSIACAISAPPSAASTSRTSRPPTASSSRRSSRSCSTSPSSMTTSTAPPSSPRPVSSTRSSSRTATSRSSSSSSMAPAPPASPASIS